MKIQLVIFEDGIKSWYKNSAYHREGDHPSVIYGFDTKEYHLEGQLIKVVKSDGSTIYVEEIDRR